MGSYTNNIRKADIFQLNSHICMGLSISFSIEFKYHWDLFISRDLFFLCQNKYTKSEENNISKFKNENYDHIDDFGSSNAHIKNSYTQNKKRMSMNTTWFWYTKKEKLVYTYFSLVCHINEIYKYIIFLRWTCLGFCFISFSLE